MQNTLTRRTLIETLITVILTFDSALCNAVALADPDAYKGKTLPVVGEVISLPQIAETLSSVTGKTIK